MMQNLIFRLSLIVFLLEVPSGLLADGGGSRASERSGGGSTGGGNGVAVYLEGQPKTLENLVRVESYVLYRARKRHHYTSPPSMPPNFYRYAKYPSTYHGSVIDLEASIEKMATEMTRKILNLLGTDNPPFLHGLTLAHRRLNTNLAEMKEAFDQVRESRGEGLHSQKATELGQIEASKKQLKSPLSELPPINDFGAPIPLQENEEYVQIFSRTKSNFSVDMDYYEKMGVEDRIDIKIHEIGYLLSHHKDSTLIQEFQLYVLNNVFGRDAIERRSELLNLMAQRWNLLHLTKEALEFDIDGVTLAESNEYYNTDGLLNIYQGAYQLGGPANLPTSPVSGSSCGLLTGLKGNQLSYLHYNPKKGSETIEVNLNDRELGIVKILQTKVDGYFKVASNYTLSSLPHYTYAFVCFTFFKNLNYVEVRKGVKPSHIRRYVASANVDYKDYLSKIKSIPLIQKAKDNLKEASKTSDALRIAELRKELCLLEVGWLDTSVNNFKMKNRFNDTYYCQWEYLVDHILHHDSYLNDSNNLNSGLRVEAALKRHRAQGELEMLELKHKRTKKEYFPKRTKGTISKPKFITIKPGALPLYYESHEDIVDILRFGFSVN